MVSQGRASAISPEKSDELSGEFLDLLDSFVNLKAIAGYLTRDDASNARHTELGNALDSLINIPGVMAYTTILESLEAKASGGTRKPPQSRAKPAKGKGKAPAPAPAPPSRPPPVPHATRPIRPLPSKLASARKEVDNSWTQVVAGTKRKTVADREEAIIALAKTFPSTTTIALQDAASAVAGRLSPSPSQLCRKKIRKHTTYGDSRKQIRVFTMPPFTWNVAHFINQVNSRLGNDKSALRVTSVSSSRGGLSLEMTDVPSATDLESIEDLCKKALAESPTDTEIRVEIPSSKSCLKICDFPYFGLKVNKDDKGKPLPISSEEIAKIISSTKWVTAIDFYENSTPRISCNSRTSDTGTIWFDIVDSRAGLQRRGLTGKSFMYGKHKLTFAAADKRSGVPQCNRCWRFGHVSTARACPFKTMTCPICRGPHSVDFHRTLATCCRGNPKAKVPILPTPEGEPCPHNAICVNCKGKHRADDRKCKFWAHRFDADCT